MGESGLNMNYEFNVLRAATNLKLKGGDLYIDILVYLVEIKIVV